MHKLNIEASYTAGLNLENNGSIATEGKDKERQLDSKHNLRVEGDEIMVDVMSYSFNPILKDTDFDGVWDGYGKDDDAHKNVPKDEKPLDNTIAGKITMTNGSDLNVDTHMDYRYFFMDKYNYYDELAVMSLILSNAVYGKNTSNLSNLSTINEKIGLNLDYRQVEEENVKLNDTIRKDKYNYKTKYAIGHKSIEYSKDNSTTNMIKKVVIPIIIPGMYEESDGKTYSEIGTRDWLQENRDHGEEGHNVMSYEVYADAILHDIDSYENIKHLPGDKSDIKKVYWVMGYKEGGAIANVLASKLIDHAKEVYTYTFASPMTLYNNKDAIYLRDENEQYYSRTGNRARYDSIFNVVNLTDVYCFILSQKLGFSKYGMTCFGGGEIYNPNTNKFETNPENVEELVKAFENIYIKREDETRTKTYEKDIDFKNEKIGLFDIYKDLMSAVNIDRRSGNKNQIEALSKKYVGLDKVSTFVNTLNRNYEGYRRAGYEDVYYHIAKNMHNSEIVNTVNYYDNRNKVNREGSDLDSRYPNFHALMQIDVNNQVPSIFQDAEVWSQFRYGTVYTEQKNNTVVHQNDKEKEKEEEKRKIRKYNDSFYPYGTFWESGCGIAAPAIVLSYLSDKQIPPMDIRNRLEEIKYPYRPYLSGKTHEELAALPKNKRVNGTAHETEEKIAELYNVNWECIDYLKKTDIEDGHIRVLKHLLKGNPVIAICGKGAFTDGGHYIVIAGVDNDQVRDLKRKAGIDEFGEEEKESKWIEYVDNLQSSGMTKKERENQLKELEKLKIYVMDPRYRHQSQRTLNDKKYKNKAKTITTAWDINTFKNGGDGKVKKFWIYTKKDTDINLGKLKEGDAERDLTELDLFDFNVIDYPTDYKEYFDPQKPGDVDEYCNIDKKDLNLDYYGKMEQKWR